jgi:hypothetical protein
MLTAADEATLIWENVQSSRIAIVLFASLSFLEVYLKKVLWHFDCLAAPALLGNWK